MTTASGGLKGLHELLLQLDDVRERIEKGPRRVKTAQRRTARREAEVTSARERLQDARKLGDQKSLQMKTHEAKIVDLKVKLNQASTNREFDLIRSQIEADEMAQSVLEDEILESYEKIDEIEKEIGELGEAVKADKENEQAVSEEVKSAEAGLKAEEESIIARLQEAESVVPTPLRDNYRRMVKAEGAGALAPVDANDVCGSCFTEIQSQVRVELNSGKIVACRSCGRLLYLAEAE